MGVNKAIILGNLGRDPEVRYTPQQTAVCNLNIATTERRKDSGGNWNDHTEWHRVVCFGRTAENCAQYLAKGRQVYIEGRIQTRKWQDKEGKDRYSTEIVADTVQFIGGGKGAQGSQVTVSQDSGNAPAANPNVLDSLVTADSLAESPEAAFSDDDIPF